MRATDFRRLALALPEALESEHMQHPDFRVGKKIFATLDAEGRCGVLKLSPQAQQAALRAHPGVFEPCAGAWGARGYTKVVLEAASVALVRPLLEQAWSSVAPAKLRNAQPGV
jgi:hypothetical protein